MTKTTSETISIFPHEIPQGQRIYAIGDVHGHLQVLKQMHASIMAEIKDNPCDHVTIVHLGDYINRGPDSQGVIEYLSQLSGAQDGVEYVHLYGNHENAVLEFIDDPLGENRVWHAWPHETFLISYDIYADEQDAHKLASAVKQGVPEAHWQFLRSLPLYHQVGDLLFVHNGPRPGVPLEKQIKEDLINNREPFMSHEEPHEFYVVHGHTSTKDHQVDVRPNRMNLDTGLFYKDGVLTCGVFEGSDVQFIRLEKT